MTPDVNVLIAAYRDDHPHHHVARAWLTDALNECAEGGTLEILPMVAAGFLRIVTNRRAFRVPAPVAAAITFLRNMLGIPGVTMPALSNEWATLEKLCDEFDLAGNQIPDAWIAATIRTNGLRLVTFDAGFGRWLHPSEWMLLEGRGGIQERRGSYVVRRMGRTRAKATARF